MGKTLGFSNWAAEDPLAFKNLNGLVFGVLHFCTSTFAMFFSKNNHHVTIQLDPFLNELQESTFSFEIYKMLTQEVRYQSTSLLAYVAYIAMNPVVKNPVAFSH